MPNENRMIFDKVMRVQSRGIGQSQVRLYRGLSIQISIFSHIKIIHTVGKFNLQ